jgi:hypothetical protein
MLDASQVELENRKIARTNGAGGMTAVDVAPIAHFYMY